MKDVDFYRVYPGLNDLGDALDAIPLDMVRHLTLIKEIDAKCISVAPRLSTSISQLMASEISGENRETKVKEIIQLLKELMPCIEEKMHVANMAADTMQRHVKRIDTDYQLITDHEIPKKIQVDPSDPALRHNRGELAPTRGTTRSETLKEARRVAAATAAASERNNTAMKPPPRTRRPPSQMPTPEPAVERAPENGDAERRKPTEQPRKPPQRSRVNSDPDEPVYCYCEQSGTGDMVGCDGPDCRREWFHLACIGLSSAPKGQWFCDECSATIRRASRAG